MLDDNIEVCYLVYYLNTINGTCS